MSNDDITIAMATLPSRVDSYINTVYELLPLCTRLCICFNGFNKIPDNLPKINKIIAIVANDDNGIPDLGCDNKMYWLGDFPGYYATVDDDIHYPLNYIQELKKKVDQYNRKAICSYHGHVYTTENGKINYYRKYIYPFHLIYSQDILCHRVGMGVAMCYPSEIGIDKSIYLSKPKNFGDDEITAVWALKNNVNLYRVENSKVKLIENIKVSRDKDIALSTNRESLYNRINYLSKYDNWKDIKCEAKILILSAGTKNLEYQYSLTNQNKEDYCKLHNYDYKFILLDDDILNSFHARKDLILKYLDQYDYVVWMDCDAWINNFDIALETIALLFAGSSLIVARDDGVILVPKHWHSCFINSGVLMFKSNDISKKIIDIWKNPPSRGVEWMQTATTLHDLPYLSIRILWDSFVNANTSVIDPKLFNKFVEKGYTSNTFILHMPGKKSDVKYKLRFILKFNLCTSNKYAKLLLSKESTRN